MAKFINNTSGSAKTYAGQSVPDGGYYQIPALLELDFAKDDLLITDLATSGSGIVMSDDGVSDLNGTASDQIDFLKNILQPRVGFIEDLLVNGRLSVSQDFDPHATNHEVGGSDEIDVTGLSGLLADPQTPISHSSTHEDGGADEINVNDLSGRLADPQPFNQSEISNLPESQLNLNFPTHDNSNDPDSDQKDALDVSITPSSANRYITKSDGDSLYISPNTPTADQKAALDNAPTAPNAGNPFVTQADLESASIVTEDNATDLLARTGDDVDQKVLVLNDEIISTVLWQAGWYCYLGSGVGTGFDNSDWLFISLAEEAAELSAVQIRESGTTSLTATYADLTFNNTDVETNANIVEHNNTNTERVDVKVTGLYRITYGGFVGTGGLNDAQFKVVINNATDIPGSETEPLTFSIGNGFSRRVLIALTAGDYVTLQGKVQTGTGTVGNNLSMQVEAARGAKGDQGDPGNNLIDAEDNGVALGSFDTLDFQGHKLTIDGTTLRIRPKRSFSLEMVRNNSFTNDWLRLSDNGHPSDDVGFIPPYPCKLVYMLFNNQTGPGTRVSRFRIYSTTGGDNGDINTGDTLVVDSESDGTGDGVVDFNFNQARNWGVDYEADNIQLTQANKYAFRAEVANGSNNDDTYVVAYFEEL